MNIQIEVINPEIVGLARDFHVNPSSCDNPNFYEQYLKFTAFSDYITGQNTTHVLLDKDSGDIFGFVAFRATTLVSDGEMLNGSPALEISVLAVNQKYEHMGYGRTLIDLAIMTATQLHEIAIGVRDIVLMADHKAVTFYKRCNFTELEEYLSIPKLNWNKDCVPMILRLGFGLGPTYVTEDNDEDDDT